METKVTQQYVTITYEEFLEYQNLKLGQEYLDVKDEMKMYSIAEKVVSILSDRGLLITERQAQEYHKLRELRDSDKLITGVEAAKILGCSPSSVSRLAARGKLEYVRVGNVNRYSKNGIYRYMKKRRVEATVTFPL